MWKRKRWNFRASASTKKGPLPPPPLSLPHPWLQSINQSILFLPKSADIEDKFDISGQKYEAMAKRYTLIHAHEKNLD